MEPRLRAEGLDEIVVKESMKADELLSIWGNCFESLCIKNSILEGINVRR